jgi:hypothetical protein
MPVDGFVPSLVMALSPRRANAGSVRFHKPEIAPPANSNHPRDGTAARAAEARERSDRGRHLIVHEPFQLVGLPAHAGHCWVWGTHHGRIAMCMSALWSMKCHCGPCGSSCALAGRAKAARTAAAKIILIACYPWFPPQHPQDHAGTACSI